MLKARSIYSAAILFVLFLALSGCARYPFPEVEYSFDPEINYRKFRTFGWYKVEAPTLGGGQDNLVDDRVKSAIASELVKEGLNLKIEGIPDLYVAYDIAVDSATYAARDVNLPPGYGFAYWYGYRYRYLHAGLPNYMDIGRYDIGTLVIDLIDPTTNQLIWRGTVDADISPEALDNSRITVVVARILSRFPPTPDITR
ncbi:DUF4136 domain-containing protein [Pontibacter sp. CAU 1760]